MLLVSLFIATFGNVSFFKQVLEVYPPSGRTIFDLISLAVLLLAINALLLCMLAFGRLAKPVLVLTLFLASLLAYFMDSFGIVINTEMLQNIAETQPSEVRDLLTPRLFAYVLIVGVLPGWLVWQVPLRWRGWQREARRRAGLIGILLLVVGVGVWSSGQFYASFIREHKILRAYANPAYPLTAVVKFASKRGADVPVKLKPIAEDAHITVGDKDRELIVLVVGETARADHFSVNGYPRETSPSLRNAQVLSFTNFWSCGSSTAVSVPCMFSALGMQRFDVETASRQENLLDVLQRSGVNVLWLDNNSDSKGVALRVPYLNFRTAKLNAVCDDECRDEGMLVSLQEYIDSQQHGDIFIVLHQMGNHGPAYYKRYPPAFEKFQPACKSNDLSQCSQEEIGNAYDNAILYTDYFLGRVIELLKRNDGAFETAMFYLSDHGESLGEKGAYLHGLPRVIAPEQQLHVPAMLWLGKRFAEDIDLPALAGKRDASLSHDNLFHTMLGLMEIRTSLYRPELDILEGCRKPE